MGNVGGGEILVILLLALIVLGPSRLPDAARKIGGVLAEVRRLSSSFQNEIRDAMDLAEEPVVKPRSAGGPTDRRAGTPTATGEPGAVNGSSRASTGGEPTDADTDELTEAVQPAADEPAADEPRRSDPATRDDD